MKLAALLAAAAAVATAAAAPASLRHWQPTLAEHRAAVSAAVESQTIAATSCGLRWAGFYQADVIAQNGSLSFIVSANATEIAQARAAGIAVLYDAFFDAFVLRPYVNGTYAGYTLRPDFSAWWAGVFNSTVAPLIARGGVVGLWLGDEVCWNGVTWAQLSVAAQILRASWPAAIIYYNEAVPVLTQGVDLWGKDVGYNSVPVDIDWFSIDYYALDNSSWLVPQLVLYPLVIMPRLHAHQCLLTVPGSYGSNYNPAFTLAQYESFMVAQATAYYNWASSDIFGLLTGINPWYYAPYSSTPDPRTGWYYEVATAAMPSVAAAWRAIGAAIAHGNSSDVATLGWGALPGDRELHAAVLQGGDAAAEWEALAMRAAAVLRDRPCSVTHTGCQS